MRNIIIIKLLILLTLINNFGFAQSTCTKLEIVNNNKNLNFECITDTCLTIDAKINEIKASVDGPNAYQMSFISFNESLPFTKPVSNRIFVNQDDVFSNTIPLPFKFCYYGNTFIALLIGANGVVSFDNTKANTRNEYNLCDKNSNPFKLPSTNNIKLT